MPISPGSAIKDIVPTLIVSLGVLLTVMMPVLIWLLSRVADNEPRLRRDLQSSAKAMLALLTERNEEAKQYMNDDAYLMTFVGAITELRAVLPGQPLPSMRDWASRMLPMTLRGYTLAREVYLGSKSEFKGFHDELSESFFALLTARIAFEQGVTKMRDVARTICIALGSGLLVLF